MTMDTGRAPERQLTVFFFTAYKPLFNVIDRIDAQRLKSKPYCANRNENISSQFAAYQNLKYSDRRGFHLSVLTGLAHRLP